MRARVAARTVSLTLSERSGSRAIAGMSLGALHRLVDVDRVHERAVDAGHPHVVDDDASRPNLPRGERY